MFFSPSQLALREFLNLSFVTLLSHLVSSLIKAMADKLKDQQVYEQLKSKHLGLGNADTTRKEWLDNIKKDTYATLVQHNPMLEYLSVGLNKPQAITRFEMIEKMAGNRSDQDNIDK